VTGPDPGNGASPLGRTLHAKVDVLSANPDVACVNQERQRRVQRDAQRRARDPQERALRIADLIGDQKFGTPLNSVDRQCAKLSKFGTVTPLSCSGRFSSYGRTNLRDEKGPCADTRTGRR